MKRKIITLALLLSINSLIANHLAAQDGSLDVSFDSDGIVTTSFAGNDDESSAMAVQPDGKILLGGYSEGPTGNYRFALSRYNTDGSLDLSFSTDGKVVTPIPGNDAAIQAIAIQSDGKIVVCGVSYDPTYYYEYFTLARYNINGSLDLLSDTDGIVVTGTGAIAEEAYALTVQPDGKILVAGTQIDPTYYYSDILLFRYNTDGSLDTTFDSDGKVYLDLGGDYETASSIAFSVSGKILVGGVTNQPGIESFALLQFNTDGSLDTTFDSDGIVTTSFGSGGTEAYSLGIQPDGKILLAGNYYEFLTGYVADIALARYNTDGSLDLTFDSDGLVTTDLSGSQDYSYGLAIQSDGKILVAGSSADTLTYDYNIALLRYNSDGSLDLTFDTDGIVVTDIGGGTYDDGSSISIQTDGKILVGGTAEIEFALLRFNNTIITGIPEELSEIPTLMASPNPFSSFTQIDFASPIKNGELNLYNIQGQIVRRVSNISGKSFTLNREGLSSGMYFISLKQENQVTASGKLILTD